MTQLFYAVISACSLGFATIGVLSQEFQAIDCGLSSHPELALAMRVTP